MPRTRARVLAAGALAAAVVSGLLSAGAAGAAGAAAPGDPVEVRSGSTPETTAFPDDRFTVADPAQLTGRRIALPVPACTAATRSTCDAVALLNTLDGFDLQPRFFLPFTGDIDVRTVTPATVYVEGPGGPVGLQQLTYDAAAHLLAGTVMDQLREQTTYTLVVTRRVRDRSGRPLGRETRVAFSTLSATTELDRLRRALDDGSAYSAAGISGRGISFTQPTATGTVTTVFPPADAELISRNDQRTTSGALTTSQVPNFAVAGVGCYAFGSFESPQFAGPDSVIAPTASGSTPAPVRRARLGVTMIVPAGTPPPGGWPVAVYGPGFTRSKFDLFVTSDLNAAAGIATVATDPIGHSYGPRSTVSVGLPGAQVTFSSYGRGVDLDGDGRIGNSEGSQPMPTDVTYDGNDTLLSGTPSPNALVGLRDGLLQTAVDNMALVRAIGSGVTVPACGPVGVPALPVPALPVPALPALPVPVPAPPVPALPVPALPAPALPLARGALLGVPGTPDLPLAGPLLPSPVPLARTGVQYYGLSFGGIYGTMLMGTDPHVSRGLLNVAGGPIVDIARLSGFRPLLGNTLRVSRPSLTNGGPGRDGFTESIPQPYEAPNTAPAAGAVTVQRYLADATWYGRPGGPEPYAPLLRLRPRYLPKTVLYQIAFGDNTVPNITGGNIIRAGDLFDRVTYYRNDRTPSAGTNPHGFLADPTLAGRQQGEAQLTAYLRTGEIVDPDGPGPVFEVPIANRDNLQCLHYPDPQTGQGAYPPPAAGECGPRPAAALVADVTPTPGPGAGAGGAGSGAPGAGAAGSGAPRAGGTGSGAPVTGGPVTGGPVTGGSGTGTGTTGGAGGSGGSTGAAGSGALPRTGVDLAGLALLGAAALGAGRLLTRRRAGSGPQA